MILLKEQLHLCESGKRVILGGKNVDMVLEAIEKLIIPEDDNDLIDYD